MSEQVLLALLGSALSRLNDLEQLKTNALITQLLPLSTQVGDIRCAMYLRELLIELIHSLKPGDEAPATSPEGRHYFILYDRYILRLPMWQIEQKLALGDRQVRREHRRALALLAARLQALLSLPHILPLPVVTAEGPASVQGALQRLIPQPRTFGMYDLVAELIVILTEISPNASAKVQWHVQPTDLTVVADRGILHQLLLKLLQTLLAHCANNESGADAIQLSAARTDGDSTATIAITGDFGALSDEARDIEALHLCQWLASLLHTDLVWSAGETQQKRVSLSLPLGTRLRYVLVIDDERPAIELFEICLVGLDYRVVGVTRPDEAVQRAIELRPDIIVLDVMMPGMDGWELLQRLRHTSGLENAPVIVCSVFKDADLAKALGAAAFLTKPILRDDLLAALHTARKQSHAADGDSASNAPFSSFSISR